MLKYRNKLRIIKILQNVSSKKAYKSLTNKPKIHFLRKVSRYTIIFILFTWYLIVRFPFYFSIIFFIFINITYPSQFFFTLALVILGDLKAFPLDNSHQPLWYRADKLLT